MVTRSPAPLRVGFVSGDGLPVSGFMTVMRNVLSLGTAMGLLAETVHADFGYAWRADKPAFFGTGDHSVPQPEWLVPSAPRALRIEGDLRARILGLRRQVTQYESLGADARQCVRDEVATLAAAFEDHFAAWLTANEIDWVFAVNMTLSDAVPATLGLTRAVRSRYGRTGAGGVLFWDHDLFGTCGVLDDDGRRVYPARPNALTPLPFDAPWSRWVVNTPDLLREASSYPTDLMPVLAPEVLPTIPDGPLPDRVGRFCREQGLLPGRPVILNPVRLTAEKGSRLAVRMHHQVSRFVAAARQLPPYLLLFGSTREDAGYAETVRRTVADLGTGELVRFLDGVPVGSCVTAGRQHLDEVDLLRLARHTGGGVFFTPSVRDVETIGLGPALAGLAHLPCATTPYDAFRSVYGDEYWVIEAPGHDDPSIAAAAELFTGALLGTEDPGRRGRLVRNAAIVGELFPAEPWMAVLADLVPPAARTGTAHPRVRRGKEGTDD